MKHLHLFLFAVMLTFNSRAQSPEKALETVKKEYSKEGIYIHYDKASYIAGETIWFKAYVIEGVLPSLYSSGISVDLLDDSGRIVDNKILPLLSGSAAGNFEIPRNAASANYLVRAHTRRMMNFGNAFFYEQYLPVYNPVFQTSAVKTPTEARLYILPEGGELIAGISNSLAFKCTDQFGSPLMVSGIITDDKNKEVASFSSVHDGMGKLNFTPKAGTDYSVLYTAGNKKLVTRLPQIKIAGPGFQVQSAGGEKYFVINSEKAGSDMLTPSYLLGVMENNVLLKQDLPASKSIRGRLPLENMPSGILQLTLFNKNDQPLAERMVFVNNNDVLVKAELLTDTFSKEQRGRNVFSLVVKDTVPGTFSVSVTDLDQDIPVSSRENIVSRLLFSNEIKDRINDPLYYFESADPSHAEHLDLVMLTSGWRKFSWPQVLENKLPKLTYKDGQYVSFAAKVYRAGTNEPLPNNQLTLIIEAPGSYDVVKLTTDSNANLLLPGMVFTDSAVINTLNSQNISTPIVMSLSSLPISKLFTYTPGKIDHVSYTTSIAGKVSQASSRYTAALNKDIKNLISLENVQVTATKKDRKKQIVRSRYNNALYSENSNGLSPFEYLYYTRGSMYFNNMSRGYVPNNVDRMFADEIVMDGVYRQLGVGGGSHFNDPLNTRNTGPAFATYSYNIPEMKNTYDNKTVLQGFSPVKEFFSPDYSVNQPAAGFVDNRSTLYWDPYIYTTKDTNRVPVSFYNSDNSKKLLVTITGIMADGKLLYIQKIIE